MAWARIPNVEVVALANRSRAKMLQKAEEFEIPPERCYESLQELLHGCEVDIIDIVTGPETHLDFVKQAAAAGKHILCQKPFAPSLEQAQEMVEVCRAAGVRLMVTENWRWLSRFQTVKALLEGGRLGKISTVRYIHTDYYTPRMAPEVELPQPFFREMPQLLFYEMGVHWYDTWRFLFGTPRRLYAETASVSPYVVGEDSGVIVLGHDDFYGFMDMSWATRQKLDYPLGDTVGPVHLEQLVIDGSEGTVKMYTDGRITFIDRNGVSEETVLEDGPLDHEESHFRLASHCIHCLNSGELFQTSGEDNLITLRMAFGTYESAFKHVPISL